MNVKIIVFFQTFLFLAFERLEETHQDIPDVSKYSKLLESTARRVRVVQGSLANIHARIAKVSIDLSDFITICFQPFL